MAAMNCIVDAAFLGRRLRNFCISGWICQLATGERQIVLFYELEYLGTIGVSQSKLL